MDLKDKIMVITGASSGIGMATARRLDRAGVKFVLNARSMNKLEALAAELSPSDRIIDGNGCGFQRLSMLYRSRAS